MSAAGSRRRDAQDLTADTGGRQSSPDELAPSTDQHPVTRTHWDALADATEQLEATGTTESPALDAEVLLRHVSGLERAQLFTRYDRPLAEEHDAAFSALVERRAAGEPVPYIIGTRWFRNLQLHVDRRVLIPRPETEAFVDYALAWLRANPGPRRVIDVGTGSGAIALALADELPRDRHDVLIVASERFADALAVARENRARLGLYKRVQLVRADLLAGLCGPWDVVLANLPYLAPGQAHPSTTLEPREALFGGADGFELHRQLLRQCATALAPGGLFVGEIDPSQSELALDFARQASGRPARVEQDLAGLDRYLLIGAWPS